MTNFKLILAFIQTHPAAWLLCTAWISLVVGSFLNVVIHRYPKMLFREWRKECEEFLKIESPTQSEEQNFNLFWPPSHCPQCLKSIKAWHNIPVLSYLLISGRCSNCHTRISMRYPLVELLSCILCLIVAYHFGPSREALMGFLFTWLLICMIFIDLDHLLLPDELTLGLLWLGLIANYFELYTDLADAMWGAVAGYMSLWTITKLFWVLTRKQGMGHGDFKLFAAFGAWVGWSMLPMILFIASASGAVCGLIYLHCQALQRDTPIPFGPYLAIGGWLVLLWGHQWWASYAMSAGIY